MIGWIRFQRRSLGFRKLVDVWLGAFKAVAGRLDFPHADCSRRCSHSVAM